MAEQNLCRVLRSPPCCSLPLGSTEVQVPREGTGQLCPWVIQKGTHLPAHGPGAFTGCFRLPLVNPTLPKKEKKCLNFNLHFSDYV